MIPQMDLRLRNMLSQLGSTGPNMPQQGVITQNSMAADTNDPANEQNIMARLAMLFHPSHQAQDQLNTTIGQMPQRGNYPPNMIEKIGGALANLGSGGAAAYGGGAALGYQSNIPGGILAQNSINDRSFNNATADWQRKLQPVEASARDENASNTNKR